MRKGQRTQGEGGRIRKSEDGERKEKEGDELEELQTMKKGK